MGMPLDGRPLRDSGALRRPAPALLCRGFHMAPLTRLDRAESFFTFFRIHFALDGESDRLLRAGGDRVG
jgi:hypothetical protein